MARPAQWLTPITSRWRHRSSKRPPIDPMTRRVQWVARISIGLITLALAGLLGRVVHLQITTPPPVAALVDTQHSTQNLQARRGAILDRRGRVMSSSDTVKRLFVDPVAIRDHGSFTERVSERFGYDPAWLEQTINQRPSSRFVVIDQSLTDERLARLAQGRIHGLGVETRSTRHYPMGSLAGQVIGFVGYDGVGMEGLEKLFEHHLSGSPGQLVYLRDAARNPIWVQGPEYQPPTDGLSVRISLDAIIQHIAETQLQKACDEFGAQAGQIVVMDPHTGEVLAMAHYPTFNPQQVGRSTPELRRNRIITDFYEPGSIFKPFVWSAATQMGLATPSEMIDCTSGLWVTSAGRRLRDAHGNGMQSWEGVLMKSSNIGMAKVGERMGAARMHRAVTAFGFGQQTGIGLEGESSGMVNQLRRWNPYSISSVPMGQEVGVTVLQITRAFCAFANDGWLVRPTIRAIDDRSQLGPAHVVGRVITPEISKLTRSVLRRAVVEGTGKKADSKMYQVFGKTGTAQVAQPNRGGYLPGAYIGSFVGGAPYDNPRLVVTVSIHRPDPRKGHYGGIIAAPAAKNVLEQSLLYLGVPPDQAPPTTPADNRARILAAANVDVRE